MSDLCRRSYISAEEVSARLICAAAVILVLAEEVSV